MTVSTCVLDSVYGRPAGGVLVKLERREDGCWLPVASGRTGSDGEVADWSGKRVDSGLYRLVLETAGYFAPLGITPFYLEAAVVFRHDYDGDDRLSIVLTPFAYLVYGASTAST